MALFVDTSAIYAVLDRRDHNSARAATLFDYAISKRS